MGIDGKGLVTKNKRRKRGKKKERKKKKSSTRKTIDVQLLSFPC
jgi:hypothetical protein